jgi:hypothetical protein
VDQQLSLILSRDATASLRRLGLRPVRGTRAACSLDLDAPSPFARYDVNVTFLRHCLLLPMACQTLLFWPPRRAAKQSWPFLAIPAGDNPRPNPGGENDQRSRRTSGLNEIQDERGGPGLGRRAPSLIVLRAVVVASISRRQEEDASCCLRARHETTVSGVLGATRCSCLSASNRGPLTAQGYPGRVQAGDRGR